MSSNQKRRILAKRYRIIAYRLSDIGTHAFVVVVKGNTEDEYDFEFSDNQPFNLAREYLGQVTFGCMVEQGDIDCDHDFSKPQTWKHDWGKKSEVDRSVLIVRNAHKCDCGAVITITEVGNL